MEGADRVQIALETAGPAAKKDVPTNHIVVRAVGGVSRMLESREREEIVLHQDGVRVRRMKPPLAMVVREVVYDDYVMSLLAAAPEVSIKHDSCARSLRLETW